MRDRDRKRERERKGREQDKLLKSQEKMTLRNTEDITISSLDTPHGADRCRLDR